MIPWNTDPELRDLIRSGEVARDLTRPLDLYALWFARTLAWRLVMVSLRCIPVFAIGIFALPALGLGSIALAPPTAAGLACFLAMLPMMALLSTACTIGTSCFQFDQVSSAGATAITAAVVSFFSGITVPLPLLGGWLEALSRLLPFRAMADVPYRFWLGQLPASELPFYLALQAGWLVALVIGTRLFMERKLARLSLAGG
jgi:ABC-2 type transport system permease protein